MQCRSVLTRVDALRTGELTTAEASEVKQHLKTCPSCDDSAHDVVDLARAVKTLQVAPPRSCRSAISDHFDEIEVEGRRVWVAFSSRGLTMIHTGGTSDDFRSRYCERFARELEHEALPERLRNEVVSALSGEGVKKPHVDLLAATEFEEKVLEVLTRIPRGQVRTYSWVAQQAGNPSAIRAVGNICARNVVPFVVPCHRVVPSTGGVGSYAFGERMKREILEREGVPVTELDELAQKRIRFTGSKTTKIFCCPTCSDAQRTREHNRVHFHDAEEALKKGYRPCRRCQPVAA